MLSFFLGGVMGCGEQVTNCYYFIQSSFALHSLHFELSRISLSISSDSLLYHLLLRQSSITVHVRRSTHLLFMISWCTFHSQLEGFARRVPVSSIMIRCNKGLENHKLKYGKGEENLSLSHDFKGPCIKMLRRNTPYGNIIYMLIQLTVTRKWPEDHLSYRFILTKQIYEKGTTFQYKIHERGTFCQK